MQFFLHIVYIQSFKTILNLTVTFMLFYSNIKRIDKLSSFFIKKI